MSMRTIVELNHDYAHAIADEPEIGSMLNRALCSGSPTEWAKLERYGVSQIVMTHHPGRCRVVCGSTVFDLDTGTTYDSPEIGLRRALERIADGKGKDPAAIARKALGRNPGTNKPSLVGEEIVEDQAVLAAEQIEAQLQSWETNAGIRLHAGELKPSEMRVARAITDAMIKPIRSLLAGLAPKAQKYR